MKQSEAKNYMKVLGLNTEKNVVSKLLSTHNYELESEEALHKFAVSFLEFSILQGFENVRVYVYRQNNMIERMIALPTGVGVKIATLEQVQEYIKDFDEDKQYMLIIEVQPGVFSIVSK